MNLFKAKVTQDIPANRLIGLGGIDTEGNPEEGWDTVYLILSKKGWIPDLVSTGELTEGDEVNVTIKGKEVWHVEASENIPAGTLVQSDDDGRVKNYIPADGNHFGFTTHSAQTGEVVEIVRKYGAMPQSQEDVMAFSQPKKTQTKKNNKKKADKEQD
jgi:predicted transcriptional regulator